MSAEEDRMVLNEYMAWRDRLAADGPDLSTAAFLAERELSANARRVEEALGAVNNRLEVLGMREGEPTLGDGLSAIRTLEEVAQTLEDDRPYVVESSLAGPTRRIYT